MGLRVLVLCSFRFLKKWGGVGVGAAGVVESGLVSFILSSSSPVLRLQTFNFFFLFITGGLGRDGRMGGHGNG